MKNSNSLHLDDAIARDGYVFVTALQMRAMLAETGPLSDWPAFVASWDNLKLDTYMADQGRYRRRRHATYAVTVNGEAQRQPHQAHYQSLDYNRLHGGIERWFEPIEPQIGDGDSMQTILRFCHKLFGTLAPEIPTWHVEAHQFRIEARADEAGHPTPEGMHRDGVDYVLVLLIQRHNITSGTTMVRTVDHQDSSFTLTEPFDAAFVDDSLVHHGVTSVQPLDPGAPAYRDVLVVTFRKAQSR